ncbi:MAG: WbqC family protein [Bacteroidales bacterium]|nr:WbqC family protein [Bacteroidales bacterium]MDY5824331.1 WbqC family protein [Candidatus Coprenecus sp.]
MDCLLSTAYFPPVEYMKMIARGEGIFIERCERYQKQSYRNRCRILASDGPLSLSIPLENSPSKDISVMRIDYSKPWILQHKRAIVSAYNSSPFFIYYMDEIFSILDRRYQYLLELNMALLEKLVVLCGIRKDIALTHSYLRTEELPWQMCDLRELIHPKKEAICTCESYYQVFSDRFGFVPSLSVLDLLCNEGPNAISFL